MKEDQYSILEEDGITVIVMKAEGEKCKRCWRYCKSVSYSDSPLGKICNLCIIHLMKDDHIDEIGKRDQLWFYMIADTCEVGDPMYYYLEEKRIFPIRVHSIFFKNNQWYGIFHKEGPDNWNKVRKLSENLALRSIHCYKSTNAYHLETIKEGYYEFVMVEGTKKERVNVQEEVQG